MKKNHKILLICFLLLLTFFSGEALSGGFYLEKGIGLPGTLAIGDEVGPQGGDWVTHAPTELEYKISNEGLIALIRCRHDRCITDHQITIGTKKETLLQHFGNPVIEKKLSNEGGTFYEYHGIGFGINKEGIIESIYIFPIFKK